MRSLVFCVATVLVAVVSVDARNWTDNTGQHKTEAEFVAFEDGMVQLRKADGTTISLPIGRLSKADQDFVRSQSKPPATVQAVGVNLADVVEKVEPSVVLIETDQGGQGSGFIVGESGLVVTSYHVIEGARTARVTFHNKLSAEVAGYVAVDKESDLALLSMKASVQLPPLPLHPDLPRKGERVAAFGAPLGFSETVSGGNISAIRDGQELQEMCAKLGARLSVDKKATWIQTTVPISSGNSGGPLTDMNGNVVGVNTWTISSTGVFIASRGEVEAQNLNFAIAVTEIRKLLANRGNELRELATLAPPGGGFAATPGGFGGATPPMAAVTRPRFSITLPSGAALTEAMTETPEKWLDMNFPIDQIQKGAPVYIATYPNGELQGVYWYKDGKLHGPAAGIHESGGRCIMANYHMSQRDGRLLHWEENGLRCLYAQYTRGKKDGLLCLFRNDTPWLIQEWDKDQLAGEYLVKASGSGFEAVAGGELKEDDAKDFVAAKGAVAEVEIKMNDGEAKLKKLLREWYREEDFRLRRRRASIAGVQKRGSMLGRAAQQDAARAAAAAAMWRTSLGRAGF